MSQSGKAVFDLCRLGESKQLLVSESSGAEEMNLLQSTSSDQGEVSVPCIVYGHGLTCELEDISWAVESAAITESPTPLLSPAMQESRSVPVEMGVSLSDLTISSSQPLTNSSSESFFHVYPGLDIGTLLASADIQSSQPFSPSPSPPMFVDGPVEPLEPIPSAVAAHLDDSTTSTGDGSAEGGQAVGDQEQAVETVQRSCARKRKASMAERTSKRINRQDEQSPRGEIECAQVKTFIEMEQEKCVQLNIPYDDCNYLSPAVGKWIATLDKEDERAAVSMISTAIGSAESIALLQQILVKSRAMGWQTKPGDDLALVDRVREIRELGGRIASCQFLRRCHIWKLFKDIVHKAASQETGFVVFTSENITTRKRGRAGNPNNFRASEITDAMICELSPEVEVNSSEYTKERRYYNRLRILGQRLDLLVETFGFGVLGLLQTRDLLEAVDVGIRINDETCVSIAAWMRVLLT